MKAFENVTMTKAELLKELRHHQKMDNFIRGSYEKGTGEDFKGCAVGCSLESLKRKKNVTDFKLSDHSAYEKHFGIPRWLAKVEDRIFEGLPADEAKKWPVQFTNAINVGADLSNIFRPYLVLVCESVLPFVDEKHSAVKAGVLLVIKLLKNKKSTKEQFLSARTQCRSAAYAAYADPAAYASAYAAAAAAAYAADAYAYAAYADPAAYASAYAAAAAAARFNLYKLLAKGLLKLIKECK